jgi:hypothetical protein
MEEKNICKYIKQRDTLLSEQVMKRKKEEEKVTKTSEEKAPVNHLSFQ